jgi:hypothetical protein
VTSRADDSVLAVIDRLNAEKKEVWSFEIINHLLLEGEVVVLGRLTVDGVLKMAFGMATVSRDAHGKPISIGEDLTAAANDALGRAARLFGVGLVFEPPSTTSSSQASGAPADAPTTPENRVTQRQLGMINGLARRRNIARGALGSMLHDRFRKTELVALTKREASDFIGELNGANGHANT